MVQTRDGYLWIGTYEGLCRFDGRHFTVFDKSNTPEIQNNGMLVMAEGADGALWIGTPNGLLCRRDGEFRNYTVEDGLCRRLHPFALPGCGRQPVDRHHPGAEPLSRRRLHQLCRRRPGPELSYISALCADRDGTLWVGTSAGLFSYRAGPFPRRMPLPGGKAGNTVWSLCAARDGTLWIGTAGDGLVTLHQGEFCAPIPGPGPGRERGPRHL